MSVDPFDMGGFDPGRLDEIVNRFFGSDPFGGRGQRVDLSRQAPDGRLDPVVGRESEVEQTLEVLSRPAGEPAPTAAGPA